MASGNKVTLKILKKALAAARAQAYPRVLAASTTLAKAMRTEILSAGSGRIFIPHYWAKYVHDGRAGGFGAKSGRFLIWWRDYREDPRLGGKQTPISQTQLRRLTTAEVKAARVRNRRHLRSGGDPSQMPVIFTEQVNSPTEGAFFFDNTRGMKGVERRVGLIIRTEVQAQARSIIRSALKDLPRSSSIRL